MRGSNTRKTSCPGEACCRDANNETGSCERDAHERAQEEVPRCDGWNVRRSGSSHGTSPRMENRPRQSRDHQYSLAMRTDRSSPGRPYRIRCPARAQPSRRRPRLWCSARTPSRYGDRSWPMSPFSDRSRGGASGCLAASSVPRNCSSRAHRGASAPVRSMHSKLRCIQVARLCDITSDRKCPTVIRCLERRLQNGPEQGRHRRRSAARPLIQSTERRRPSESTELRLDAAKEVLSPTE